MAIAYDTSGKVNQDASDTSISLTAFTIGAGADRYLVAGVMFNSGTDAATSATADSVAMTKLGSSFVIPNDGRLVTFYGLVAPNSGSQTIVVNFSGAETYTAIHAVSFSGVAATGQPGSQTDNDTGGSPSTSFAASTTTVANDAWLVFIGRGGATAGLAAGANTTVRQHEEGYGLFLATSDAATGTAGSKSLNFTETGSNNWGGIVISLNPATGGGGAAVPVFMNQFRQRRR